VSFFEARACSAVREPPGCTGETATLQVRRGGRRVRGGCDGRGGLAIDRRTVTRPPCPQIRSDDPLTADCIGPVLTALSSERCPFSGCCYRGSWRGSPRECVEEGVEESDRGRLEASGPGSAIWPSSARGRRGRAATRVGQGPTLRIGGALLPKAAAIPPGPAGAIGTTVPCGAIARRAGLARRWACSATWLNAAGRPVQRSADEAHSVSHPGAKKGEAVRGAQEGEVGLLG